MIKDNPTIKTVETNWIYFQCQASLPNLAFHLANLNEKNLITFSKRIWQISLKDYFTDLEWKESLSALKHLPRSTQQGNSCSVLIVCLWVSPTPPWRLFSESPSEPQYDAFTHHTWSWVWTWPDFLRAASHWGHQSQWLWGWVQVVGPHPFFQAPVSMLFFPLLLNQN